jgi:membrane-associated phospholipid phosphatase
MLNHNYTTSIILITTLTLSVFIFLPIIDHTLFYIFNGHLIFMPLWYKKTVALLNHRFENTANIIIILLTFFLNIPKDVKKARTYFLFILGSALWYELFFQLFVKLDRLGILHRSSPSLTTILIDLSLFDPQNIKVYAYSSFPSGHAMILGYWATMSYSLFPKTVRNTCLIMSYFFCMPRLIAGAHWFSDVLAGYLLGKTLFSLYLMLWEAQEKAVRLNRPLPLDKLS